MSEGQGEKFTHHFGRGGAGRILLAIYTEALSDNDLGNITAKSDKAVTTAPATTPTLKSKNYTTGRGGTGNIVRNEDPETARMAQDVDVPGIALPEGDHHTGRGE